VRPRYKFLQTPNHQKGTKVNINPNRLSFLYAGLTLRQAKGSDVAIAQGAADGVKGSGMPSLRFLAAASALVAILAVLSGPVSAEAATSYANSGEFGSEAFAQPTRIAVDDQTGNVLVVDSGQNLVQVYDSAGPSATLLTSFGGGELSSPYGIAVDQTTHKVYVTDPGGNRIVRYESDGGDPPTYTPDNSFVSPVQGSEAQNGQIGSFSSSLAVDPTNGDLLVADVGNRYVSRFTSSGGFVSSFNGEGSAGGAFTRLLDLAVVPGGEIYVVADGIEEPVLNYMSGSRVVRFAADGTSSGSLGAGNLDSARSIASDPGSGNVIVATGGGYEQTSSTLRVFHNGSFLFSIPYPSIQSVIPQGLAVDGGSSGRLYAPIKKTFFNAYGVVSVQVFDPVPLPDLVLDPPATVTATGAHLSGSVNPLGRATSYRFEYSADGGKTWTKTPDAEAGEGEVAVPVETDLGGLAPNMDYTVRLFAANTKGSAMTPVQAFRTAGSAPGVTTTNPTDITTNSAFLHGTINPFGSQSTYYFEYGTTTAYGSRVPLANDGVAGNGRGPVQVSHQITALSPNTQYHYRLVGTNSAGTSGGEDVILTTDSAGIPARGYEMVSPVEKNGVAANSHPTGARASEDGNVIAFGTEQASYPGTDANPYIARAYGLRSATDWASGPLALPFANTFPAYNFFFSTVAVSKDVTHALILSTAKLTPDGVAGEFNLYLTAIGTENYTLVATDPRLSEIGSSNGNYVQVGTSDDLHTIAFTNLNGVMFVATIGKGVQVASILPDGEVVTSGVQTDLREPNQISADGSRIFFGAFASEAGLFMRENGEVTKRISPGYAQLVSASPDGRYVVYFEDGKAYRYDIQTEELKLLASEVGEGPFRVARPESADLYFAKGDALSPRLYFSHEGTVTFIAEAFDSVFPGFGPQGAPNEYTMSPNGRYLAFQSITNLTSFDSGGYEEIYLYDSQTDALICSSCRVDGGQATGNASLESAENGGSPFNRLAARSVLDDGTVLFDTPDPLVAADANGTRDVYTAKGGRITLISRGKLPTESNFVEATPDGSSIFFVTNDRLVGQDRDDVPDLYVSRVGGGLASQNPPPPIECVRDDCKATPNAGPELPFGGSEGLTGPGNVQARVKKHCGKGRHRAKVAGKTRCVKVHKRNRKNGNRRQAR
jgi:DNA-binding beta-propeller fold protein YncE